MGPEQHSQNVLQIALKTTIKLFYRPEHLKGSLKEAVDQLQWNVDDGKLSVSNRSGFNVVVSEVLVNNTINKDFPEVIKPASTLQSAQALKSGDKIVLSYINEYGSTVKVDPVTVH